MILAHREREELGAGRSSGDEFDLAGGETEGFREQLRDGGVGFAIGGWGGDADVEDAFGIEAGDGVGGGAGSDADLEAKGHGRRVA